MTAKPINLNYPASKRPWKVVPFAGGFVVQDARGTQLTAPLSEKDASDMAGAGKNDDRRI